jgi:hypothetical protein
VGSKDKNIAVRLINFKKAYKMEDAVHVHSEQDDNEDDGIVMAGRKQMITQNN